MHNNNNKWLSDLRHKYSEFMDNCRVLELGSGSQDFAGTIRPWFRNCIEYVGIDIVDGPGVDIITEAKNTKLKKGQFDTIACFSLLEHDLEWRKSLKNNLRWLRRGGMIFMCWGAEGNLPHMDIWELVPHNDVIIFLEGNGIKVIDAFFEEDRYGKDCAGAFDLIGIKI